MLSPPSTQVQSVVGELRSHKACGAVKIITSLSSQDKKCHFMSSDSSECQTVSCAKAGWSKDGRHLPSDMKGSALGFHFSLCPWTKMKHQLWMWRPRNYVGKYQFFDSVFSVTAQENHPFLFSLSSPQQIQHFHVEQLWSAGFFFLTYLFTYLAVPGLSCGTWGQYLWHANSVAACRI